MRKRVSGVVDRHQSVDAHVGVALRRREARVAEELLDRPQVGAGVEEVRRAAVAERVRVEIRAIGSEGAVAADDVLDLACRQRRAVPAEEESARVLCAFALASHRRPRGEPLDESRVRGPAERHDALLVALADRADGSSVEVDAVEREPRELADTEPAGVEHLEHRAIARLEPVGSRRVGGRRLDDAERVLDREELRERTPRLRRLESRRRVRARDATLHEEAIERAQRGHLARERRRRVATVPLGEIRPERDDVELSRVQREALLARELAQGAQVASVRRDGARREPALVGEVALERFDLGEERVGHAFTVAP